MKPLSDTSIAAIGLILSVLGAVACNDRKQDRPAPQLQPVAVAQPVVDSVTIYAEYPATLQADRTIDIVAEVNGQLQSIYYNPGDFVRQGQPLFAIDPTVYTQAVQQAQANLAQAQAQYEYAEPHYQAVARALQSNAVSKMEVAQALSARDQALAAINTAKAALASARTQLAKCRIAAPASGHITFNNVSRAGYVAGAGQPFKLATLYVDDNCLINFNITERDVPAIRQYASDYGSGRTQPLTLVFQDSLKHSYRGDIIYVAPEIDPSTGTMLIQGKVANPYGELRSGMYLTVKLPSQRLPQAVLVRDAAVGTDQRGNFVYTLGDSSQVVYTPVETGPLVRDSMRVIYSGLTPDQTYITAAQLKVRPGAKIKPVRL